MKRRKGLLLVIVALAVSCVMGAMAYNSAYVVSSQSLTISTTDQALIALIPGTGPGNKDLTASIKADGVLDITFGKSGISKNGVPGLQPQSQYTWNHLFTIWNKSAETLNVCITVDENVAPYLTLKGKADPNQWYNGLEIYNRETPLNRHRYFTLDPDSSLPITASITLESGTQVNGLKSGAIVVNVEGVY